MIPDAPPPYPGASRRVLHRIRRCQTLTHAVGAFTGALLEALSRRYQGFLDRYQTSDHSQFESEAPSGFSAPNYALLTRFLCLKRKSGLRSLNRLRKLYQGE